MASKAVERFVATKMSELPVNSIEVRFDAILKSEYRSDNLNRTVMVDEVITTNLPDRLEVQLIVDNLKGMPYSKEYKQAVDNRFYEVSEYMIRSRSGNDIALSHRTLTDQTLLIKWMLNNAAKLYLSSTEKITNGYTFDRNFAAICGEVVNPTEPWKVYVSSDVIKYVKQDVKEIKEVHAVLAKVDYAGTQLRALRNAYLGLEGVSEMVASERESQAALRASKKQLLLAGIK